MDAGGRYSNRRRAVERLVSAWNGEVSGVGADDGESAAPLIEAATETRRRTRTPLTPDEVDAIRTQRAAGISVNSLARQFSVARQTIWAKTRSALR